MASPYILTISCPDRIGIVATVSTFLAVQRCNILDSAQFGDRESKRFFLRIHFEMPADGPGRPELERLFAGVAGTFDMEWQLFDAGCTARILVLVSRFGHCLNDIMFRCETGALNATIPAIVSNHHDFQRIAEMHDIPFHYLPISKENKAEQEECIAKIIEEQAIDLVVLARYMQILSPEFCARFKGRVINIHHSFLPSFKGASPYHQAFARGVKLIGATAHYVTENLDEGPIIEQEVARVDHSHMPDDLVAVGRDVECLALARAVRFHIEHRVLLNGSKTVVFR